MPRLLEISPPVLSAQEPRLLKVADIHSLKTVQAPQEVAVLETRSTYPPEVSAEVKNIQTPKAAGGGR
jgi:hypothetical protein